MEIKELLQQVKAEAEIQRKQMEGCTFDAYKVTSGNEEAYHACLKLAECNKDAYQLLYLYGKKGVGKTHLLRAVKNYMSMTHPEKKVKLTDADEFTAEVIWILRDGGDSMKIEEEYKKYDVFLLDDIQYLSGKESPMREFSNILNLLKEEGKMVVLTADCSPAELVGFDNIIVAHLERGYIVGIS